MTVTGANNPQPTSPSVPPKRAQRMSRPQRRAQLLAVATQIVQTSGISSLTMAALAQLAGVSKPVVYEIFQNSEDVALALLDEYFKNIVELVQENTQGAETLDAYISCVIDVEFEFHARGALSIRSITNGHTSSHATGERLNAAFLKIRKQAIGTFRELLLQQGLAIEKADAAGYVLSEMLNHTVAEFGASDPDGHARATLKAMMLASVHAICPDPSQRPMTPDWIIAEFDRVKGSAEN